MHLWNKLIQILILSDDVSSIRLAFQLIEDKDSILYWIWGREAVEKIQLPHYNLDSHNFGLIYHGADNYMDRGRMERLYYRSGYASSESDGHGSFLYLQSLKKKLNV